MTPLALALICLLIYAICGYILADWKNKIDSDPNKDINEEMQNAPLMIIPALGFYAGFLGAALFFIIAVIQWLI
jgi:uncharacterized membrane protein YfcA